MAFNLSERYVIAAEETLGAPLPASYRALMKHKNGGSVFVFRDEWLLFPIADRADSKRIKRTASHLIAATRQMELWQGWPEGALAIARNGAGDVLLFLRFGDAYTDAVYLWDHETGELSQAAAEFAALRGCARAP